MYEGPFELRQDMREVHRTLAYDLDRVWQANDKTMVRMLQGFRIAAAGLGLEVVVLLAAASATLL